jgi:hypothetical protein
MCYAQEMTISIDTKLTLAHYSSSEIEKMAKKSPYLDLIPPLSKEKYTARVKQKSGISKFFDQILENKVKAVAMMVFLHILHFFCLKFWGKYRARFTKRAAEQQKKVSEIKHFKLFQKIIEARMQALTIPK